jgi:hypothetical protein
MPKRTRKTLAKRLFHAGGRRGERRSFGAADRRARFSPMAVEAEDDVAREVADRKREIEAAEAARQQ